MGSIPVAEPSPLRRSWWSKRLLVVGVVVLTLGGLLAALLALFLWPEGEPPEVAVVKAGQVDDFEPGSVSTFRELRFHLVRLENGEFLALYDLDTHPYFGAKGCRISWQPNRIFEGRLGWFRGDCSGSTFNIDGQRAFGPSPRGMDRFPVLIENGEVRVYTNKLISGTAVQPASGTPTPAATPPAFY